MEIKVYYAKLKIQFIENFGEGVYCLDTFRIENGECPVVDWDQGEGVGDQEYDDFLSFLIERFSK
ncbi:SMI1/KNR4 family protein [Brevibacillus laterosporus]|uniref:SMI1/KNR4 family protein n=1 Tax=Brevibacillus laterosporus TaxID=1465 RepID=UPI00399D3E1A